MTHHSSAKASSVTESFCNQAHLIASAAMALGSRMIGSMRGQEGRVIGLSPSHRSLSASVKQKLLTFGQRVNDCAQLLGKRGENPLYELGPEFFSEGDGLRQALLAMKQSELPLAAWAKEAKEMDERRTEPQFVPL